MSKVWLASWLPGKIHLLYLFVPYESVKPSAHKMSSMFLGEPENFKMDKNAESIKT